MRQVLRLFLLILICFSFSGVHAQSVQENRKLDAFENVLVETSDDTDVFIRYDKVQRVVVKTEQRYIEEIKTKVSHQTLKIYFDLDRLKGVKVQVYVYMPRVTKVSVAGGGNVEVLDGINPLALEASIAGGGQMMFKEVADVVNFTSSVVGGGSIDALKLQVKKANVAVSGGGRVLLQVEDQLDGIVAGGGDILYEGDPKVSYNVVGGGVVRAIRN